MGRELQLWEVLYTLCVAGDNPKRPDEKFSDGQIAAVYFWSVVHDRPVNWACVADNWCRRPGGPPVTASTPTPKPPSQPTMSRRLRTRGVRDVLDRAWAALAGMSALGMCGAKLLDGLPLPVGPWSKDRKAKRGWAARGLCRGYKLHVVWGCDGGARPGEGAALPLAWDVRPMNHAECRVALELIEHAGPGGNGGGLPGEGYLLGDSQFDTNDLHDLAAANGHLLMAPRKCPGRPLGRGYQSPYRLLCLELLEPSELGRNLPQELASSLRKRVDRRFGNLTCRGGGLGSTTLPAWVRTPRRVKLWVMAKLLVNAAYIRLRERAAATEAARAAA